MKKRILEWLFSDYVKNIKTQSDKELQLKLEAYKASLDQKDIVRERLRGVRPNKPDDNSLLQIHLASLEDISRLAFLAKAHDAINNNETLKKVIDSLMVETEHKAVLYAGSIEEVNFNRATINGLMLLEEELQRLANMYVSEREATKEITTEERFSAL